MGLGLGWSKGLGSGQGFAAYAALFPSPSERFSVSSSSRLQRMRTYLATTEHPVVRAGT